MLAKKAQEREAALKERAEKEARTGQCSSCRREIALAEICQFSISNIAECCQICLIFEGSFSAVLKPILTDFATDCSFCSIFII